jgi:hypothetical protein
MLADFGAESGELHGGVQYHGTTGSPDTSRIAPTSSGTTVRRSSTSALMPSVCRVCAAARASPTVQP